jgi:(4-O-methyl)-D-glucuronate---lignin esterase
MCQTTARDVMGVLAGAFSPLVNGSIQLLPEWYRRGEPKPSDGRVTFTTWKHYTKDSPLLQSGLIGPVTLWGAVIRS